MAGSPVGETVRDLLHALEPPPPSRDATQHGADAPKQETGAQLQQGEPQRADTAPPADQAQQREDYRAAHWKQAMMQHKRAWRPEEWWNAARKRAHGHEGQGGSKAERRRAEAASWRAAAAAQSQETAAQPQADAERLRVDDIQQAGMPEQVRKQMSELLACPCSLSCRGPSRPWLGLHWAFDRFAIAVPVTKPTPFTETPASMSNRQPLYRGSGVCCDGARCRGRRDVHRGSPGTVAAALHGGRGRPAAASAGVPPGARGAGAGRRCGDCSAGTRLFAYRGSLQRRARVLAQHSAPDTLRAFNADPAGHSARCSAQHLGHLCQMHTSL